MKYRFLKSKGKLLKTLKVKHPGKTTGSVDLMKMKSSEGVKIKMAEMKFQIN